ncbi:heavy metal transporter [Cellulosimicrobium marinum]|uniref:heavy metal transporter n=1 Tax=Cellulosimicrobium marinum TaxID=1638992 RepID=UPI001E5C582C|nr:heavy metal transporter [Cellulosimicrobium marinum]MCB7135876.1 heavy metal transporter [Cellulosimicrobium marinum]
MTEPTDPTDPTDPERRTSGREMRSDVHPSDAGASPGSTAPPPRVRVRSTDPAPPARPGDRTPRADAAASGTTGPPAPAGGDDAAAYAGSLARTQLRLALVCTGAFLVVVLLLTLLLTTTDALDDVVLVGVPLPWLLHAYAYYPVIVAFAVVFAVAASRNERRFRALTEPDPAEEDA